MERIAVFKDFIKESVDQSKSGKDFEDYVGGLLKGTDVIKEVYFKNSVLYVVPIENLGSIDISLITAMFNEESVIDKLKKKYKGINKVSLDKITIDV